MPDFAVRKDIAAKATELSAKQYELQDARFKAGLSTSRLVLQAQDDLEAARLMTTAYGCDDAVTQWWANRWQHA